MYKYFTDRKWADAFLDGEVFFHSLAYFRDYEDECVRKDSHEGTSVFRPTDGLVINNHTRRRAFTLTGYAFESTANQEEIFVFCASRSFTDELRSKFQAVACVEIRRPATFCERLTKALPASATIRAGRVEYYDPSEGPGTRWALPDQTAMSKFNNYKWQDEFRIVFCLTDALKFEHAALRLVKDNPEQNPERSEHREYSAKLRNLRDICRLHEF
ncbi:MAG TPA: hypothetical protein VN862_03775 [Candidatus Acidoferrales bacterium]|nr:hypothetical protein [Candidatus Acidoferrales bacterium]